MSKVPTLEEQIAWLCMHFDYTADLGGIDPEKFSAAEYRIAILASLRRLAELERDALRYRWLRDVAHPDGDVTGLSCMEQRFNDWGKSYHHHFTGADLDAAVDAAIYVEKST